MATGDGNFPVRACKPCTLYIITHGDPATDTAGWDQVAADEFIKDVHLTFDTLTSPEFRDDICDVCQDEDGGLRFNFHGSLLS